MSTTARGRTRGRFSAPHLEDGKPAYTYNWLGLQRYTIAGEQALPPGKSTIRFEFAYDGGGAGNEWASR